MKQKVAAFGYSTPNLGDDMQAIAAVSQYPWLDTLVNRDRLDVAKLEEQHLCTMASWFLVKNYKRLPRSQIDPIFFGFCLGRDVLLETDWLGYLKENEPIGSRDLRTADKLKAAGVDSYYSGCITLFMGKRFRRIPAEERSGIVFVDVPEADGLIPQHVKDASRSLTNFTTPDIVKNPFARWTRIAATCDILRRAELVVTRRLHTALPCVGFGTPVVVILEDKPKSRGRFSGYEEFMNIVWIKDGKPSRSIDWESREPSVIPARLEESFDRYREELKARIGSLNDSVSEDICCKLRLNTSARAERLTVKSGIYDSVVPIAYDKQGCYIEGVEMMKHFRMDVFADATRFSKGTYLGKLSEIVSS
ncbi:MAG: polysaccharide pyruvyl transferase family protein [Verrucomicrobiota bacterium]